MLKCVHYILWIASSLFTLYNAKKIKRSSSIIMVSDTLWNKRMSKDIELQQKRREKKKP